MRFVIDIDMDAIPQRTPHEIARILRYWAGALPQMDLSPGVEQELMDSSYSPVGLLRVTT